MSGATLSPDHPDLADAAARWRSAYIHIPFCGKVCPYCDFAVIEGQDGLTDRYVAALLAEIAMVEDWHALDAVFFGGGTPSRLDVADLGRVVAALDAKFGLCADAEVSMEANPEDWSSGYADGVASAGLNRVSFGAQSFDDDVLAQLGRLHVAQDTELAVEASHKAGLAVSIDLIFGEPSESMASWEYSMATALALSPQHLSTYALTVERGTPLSRSVAGGDPAPDEDDQADKYERSLELLASSGLVKYEVSNAALPGHACRYNLSTWAQGEYLAFGLGAHGHIGGVRRRNVRRLDRYLESVEAGLRPTAGEDTVRGWDAELERLMLGLRRTAGVVMGTGGEALVDTSKGQTFLDHGVIAIRDGRIVMAQPLLTDMVIREILSLPGPLSVSAPDC